MRTNIEIDDDLMRKAMAACGASTKKAAVEEGLRLLTQLNGQGEIRKLWGKVSWRGHDDDWFASDEEIGKKRQRVHQEPVSNEPVLPSEAVSRRGPR